MPETYESIKIRGKLLEEVRELKKTTGVPIISFIESAIEQKLKSIKKSKSKTNDNS